MNKKELRNALRQSRAHDFTTLGLSYHNMNKASIDRYMGSAVTITIKNINLDDNVIIEETLISDGLSQDTIEAIKRDIKRTQDLKVSLFRIISEVTK